MKAYRIYNKIFLTIIGTLFLFTACREAIPDRDPSPVMPENCLGVYFPTTNPTVVELEPSEPTQFSITISRVDSVSAAEVPITVETNKDNVFVVPEKAVFEANAKETTLTITFPKADVGISYDLKLLVSGDQYVNKYASSIPYFSTTVTRVKWTVINKTIIMVNPFWGGDVHYIPKAEIASYASGDIVNSIRLTNPFLTGGGGEDIDLKPDENGIYDGVPAIWPVEIVRDNVQLVITIDKEGNASMSRGGIGAQWYDIEMEMFPQETGVAVRDKDSIVLIDFPAKSLVILADSEGSGWPNSAPLQIYFSLDDFLAANKKIKDFNKIEYEEIKGAVSEFESVAYSESWSQSISKAVDIDEKNKDSEYKNLYYLANLYADEYGLAFYYNGKTVSIPAEQATGKQVLGKDIYVSQSEELASSVTTNVKGIDVYTLGLTFHFEDGTVVGEFAEKFYYSKNSVAPDERFIGNFTFTGKSLFEAPDAEMDVTIAKGPDNTVIITGIDLAESVTATVDPLWDILTIEPQSVGETTDEGGTYALSFWTYLSSNELSAQATLTFVFNTAGQLVLTEESEAIGYIIYGENIADASDAGYFDGYYDLSFTPRAVEESASSSRAPASNVAAGAPLNRTTNISYAKPVQSVSIAEKTQRASTGNFIVKGTVRNSARAVSRKNLSPLF
jgi:hypothetical protein